MRVPSKKQTLLAFLKRGVAMVHLDARRPGVTVPPQYASDAHLRLNLSLRYAIPDLDISDKRIQATLSFGGRPFQCLLPWEAIFAITVPSGDGQVWTEDLPEEVMDSMAGQVHVQEHVKEAERRLKKDHTTLVEEQRAKMRPTPPSTVTPVSLTAVQGPSQPDERPQEQPKVPPAQRHLRLVR
jgi:stringent starvation protein B